MFLVEDSIKTIPIKSTKNKRSDRPALKYCVHFTVSPVISLIKVLMESGKAITIPIVINNDEPLPTPNWVMRSASHIVKAAPAVNVKDTAIKPKNEVLPYWKMVVLIPKVIAV